MAAPMVEKVHVQYEDLDTGSEADSEVSNDLDDEFKETEEDDPVQEKKGLADVFAKILHKNVPSHKQVILAKGKTDREIQKRKLETDQGEDEKSAKQKTGDGKPNKTGSFADIAQNEKVKLWENMCRSKPDPLNRDKERQLQRIATRGVVQLFNAVKKQQKTLEEEIQQAGTSERKKDKIIEGMTKDKFLNILKGTSTTNVKVEPVKVKKEVKKEESSSDDEGDNVDNKKWDILRDDYMMGAKMKDWDKDDSDDETGPGDPNMSDSD